MKKYLIHGGIGFLLSVLLACLRFSGWEPGAQSALRAASDGFTVVGFLYLATAALGKISSTGFFDIFSYGLREGVHFLIPGIKKIPPAFYDYRAEREEKRRQRDEEEGTGRRAALLTGLVLFVLGILFTLLFYAVS